MIHLTAQTRIELALQPLDFRKGIDGVAACCHERLQTHPRSGTLFVFFNRSRTAIRVLAYENAQAHSGYWLMAKRLSKGRFAKLEPRGDDAPSRQIASRALRELLRTLQA